MAQLLDYGGQAMDSVYVMDLTYRQVVLKQQEYMLDCDVSQFGSMSRMVRPAYDIMTFRAYSTEGQRRDYNRDKKTIKNLRREGGESYVREQRYTSKTDLSEVNAVAVACRTMRRLVESFSSVDLDSWTKIATRLQKLDSVQCIISDFPLRGAGGRDRSSHCLFKAFAEFEKMLSDADRDFPALLVPRHHDINESLSSYVKSNPDEVVRFRGREAKLSQKFSEQEWRRCFVDGIASEDVIAVYSHLHHFDISMKAGSMAHTFMGNSSVPSASDDPMGGKTKPRLFLNHVPNGRYGHWEVNKRLTWASINRRAERIRQWEDSRAEVQSAASSPQVAITEAAPVQIPYEPMTAVVVQRAGEDKDLPEAVVEHHLVGAEPSAPKEDGPHVPGNPLEPPGVNVIQAPNPLEPPKKEGLKQLYPEYCEKQYPRVYHHVFKGDNILPMWRLTLISVLVMALELYVCWMTWGWAECFFFAFRVVATYVNAYLARRSHDTFEYNLAVAGYYALQMVTLVRAVTTDLNLSSMSAIWSVVCAVNARFVFHKEVKIVLDQPRLFRSKPNKLCTKDDAEHSTIVTATMIIAHKFWYGMPDWLATVGGMFPGNYHKVQDFIPVEVLDASLHPRHNAGFIDRETSFDRIGRLFRTQDSFHTNFVGQFSVDHTVRVSMMIHEMRRNRHEDFQTHLT